MVEEHSERAARAARNELLFRSVNEQILEMTERMAEIIARHSGRPVEQVMKDIDRDHFMTPQEAVEYGLADQVMTPRGLPLPVR